jgi:hypothetical protein
MLPSHGVVNGNLHHILCVCGTTYAIYRHTTKSAARRSSSDTYGDETGEPAMAGTLRMGEFHLVLVTAGWDTRSYLTPVRGSTFGVPRSPFYLLSPLASVSALSAKEAAST